MNVLVIEDNQLKREKIVNFLEQYAMINVREAASYNSGLTIAMNEIFDLIIIDMSMPTFDKTDMTQGGRFRSIAGKEIALKLKKHNKLPTFVILTGYRDFSVNTENLSLEEIHEILSSLGSVYKGYIIFDSAEIYWQEKLSEIIGTMEC